MKGIILCAGKGTRLYPMTKPVCKPLLPVYDKPLIYYSIATLVQAGMKEMLVIIPPGEEETFRALLGDGSQCGLKIEYAVQTVARGIADAFIVGKDFIGDDDVCLILGDNIFYSEDWEDKLIEATAAFDGVNKQAGATVFGYWVEDPRPFGVIEFDAEGKALSIEEKPAHPKSNYIIPGLYFYDNRVVEIAENLKPSARGELEISDVNAEYLDMGELKVVALGENFVWKDAGTAESLLDASNTIAELQAKSGKYVGCPEEIAYKRGICDKAQLEAIGNSMSKTEYGKYLLSLVK